MTNEELRKCHFHVNIPANDGDSSLNLAAAVQVVCYELRMAVLAETSELAGVAEAGWDQPYADAAGVEKMMLHLESTLAGIGFFDPKNPKQMMSRLRRLVNRVRLDKLELNMLRGILAAVDKLSRKIKEN